MDQARAEALLAAERARVQSLLDGTIADGQQDRDAANQPGDLTDPAERLIAEEGDDVIAAQLRDRLEALGRAERRLADGTFGKSVRSGQPIPDERLEADPAAELTTDEAAAG
jgi:DnaK suppressor protein